MIALQALRPYAARRSEPVVPRCELCGEPIGEDHGHVVELGVRGVRCACRACAILFAEGARYRTVPDRVIADPAFAVAVERWEELGVPVELAFFVRDSVRATIGACYPGPAGIVDADLDAATWSAICAATPLARELSPDVEALLVHRARGAPAVRCYLVPITKAYELAGRLRASWRGLLGGDAVQRELAGYFARLERGER